MSEKCEWLHTQLEHRRTVKYPFSLETLPENGVYFFYELGEAWGHGGDKPRIVRVGTSKDGNFQSRIAEHYLLDETKMNFNAQRSAPHDRSIFRKNIGRALLNKHKDNYLNVWELDFTSHKAREEHASQRHIEKEKKIESVSEYFQSMLSTLVARYCATPLAQSCPCHVTAAAIRGS